MTLCDPAVVTKSLRLVRRDGDAEGQREIALQFVERHLNGSADIFAEQRERIGEAQPCSTCASGIRFLGLKLRRDAELAVGRNRHMEDSGDVVQRLAFDHDLA